MDQKMETTNHLMGETSPYLLQHAHNPVDWYPWGEEALQKAKREDKPIFLSIGYSACHWCHVMEKESFTDEQVAGFLNKHFISIKVDREERPDLDSLYMSAVVLMTGQGGWPMTVFLTPDREPFFGGTYFPLIPSHGLISLPELLKAIHQAWQQDREHIFDTAKKITERLKAETVTKEIRSNSLRQNLIETARDSLVSAIDWQNGGWGRAPKFPQPLVLEFLGNQAWRGHEPSRKALIHTLDTMSRGGMYDLISGGFHRYSTDLQWLVPHFEKMLYDNAQLSLVYLHAYLLTKNLQFKKVCIQTLDFIIHEMTNEQGGFFSSIDADSDGEEGKYYLWTETELKSLLTKEQQKILKTALPYPADGNYEGKIILQKAIKVDLPAEQLNITVDELSVQLDYIFQVLREARKLKLHPAVDTKVLIMWNSLALRAFAEAARYLDRHDYLEIAQKNADFLLSSLRSPSGLLRSWNEGKAKYPAYLEDYASLIIGLLALYQADFNNRWYSSACSLRDEMADRFKDPAGGYFDVQAGNLDLLFRPKELQDSSTPSGNALAVRAELLMDEFTENTSRAKEIENFIAGFQDLISKYPSSFGYWLQILDFIKGPVYQLALVYPLEHQGSNELMDCLGHTYIPNSILSVSKLPIMPDAPKLLNDRTTTKNLPTAYVCQDFLCHLPTTNLAELTAQLPAN